jgi:hypothetical protein
VRPLVLVAGGGINRAGKVGADRRVAAADLDALGPRRSAVARLAEVDGAVGALAGAGVGVEAGPGGVDVVDLGALLVGVGDDEFLVVKDRRIVVAGDHAERVGGVFLERLLQGAVV